MTERQQPPVFRAWVVPGGKMMESKTDGAVGYDTYLRAIVDPFEKDTEHPALRKTLYNFLGEVHDDRLEDIVELHDFHDGAGSVWTVRLDPDHWLHCAIGVVLEIEFPWYGDLRPRSGLASRGINLMNTPGTIDPDYRGEACAILTNVGSRPYWLRHNERIAQMLILEAFLPPFEQVGSYEEMTQTVRATGGFGSTGTLG